MKLLEVIVTALDEAQEAEQGGADRLEVVSQLELEGLTPDMKLVEEILASIPIRVMLRKTASFEIESDSELASLEQRAKHMAELPIDGVVLGFLRGNAIDDGVMRRLLDASAPKSATFHRAFEAVSNQPAAVEEIKSLTQVNRILTNGGDGNWIMRRRRLEDLQRLAGSEIGVITGGGLNEEGLRCLAESPLLTEFHVGRAARDSSMKLNSGKVAELKRILEN
jgi:copper homeostasis protein